MEILQTNQAAISRKLGRGLVMKKALVRDLAKPQPAEADGLAVRPLSALTRNPADITQSPDIDVVVEVMGGLEPARTYILDALRAGKDVVTAPRHSRFRHRPRPLGAQP